MAHDEPSGRDTETSLADVIPLPHPPDTTASPPASDVPRGALLPVEALPGDPGDPIEGPQRSLPETDQLVAVPRLARHEIVLDDDTDGDAVREHIDGALSEGGTLWLTDRRGRQYGVPVDKVAYVEIGATDKGRHIGFGG